LDVEKVIKEQIFANSWNLDKKFDNKKAIFNFIFRGDFIITGWLSVWCGYHSAFNIDGIGIIKYTVIGDASFSKSEGMALRCKVPEERIPTPNGNLGGDSVVSIYAHEIAEVITDYYNDAWYFDNKNNMENENGDVCVGNYGTSIDASNSNIKLGNRSFLIQSMYLPGVGCVMTNASASTITAIPTTTSSRAPTPLSPTAFPSLAGDIEYHVENEVMKGAVNLYNIYIGDIDPSTKTLVDYFSANIGSSTWFDIVGSYYEVIQGRTTLAANATAFRGSKSFNSTARGITITEKDVIAIIKNAVSKTSGWQFESSGIYTVIFRGDFRFYIQEKGNWPYDWCHHRGSFSMSSPGALASGYKIKYSIIGDSSATLIPSNGARCQPLGRTPTSNLNTGGDSIVAYYAYIIASTITNPYLKSWYFRLYPADASSKCGMKMGNYTGNANVQVGQRRFLLPQIWLRGYGCAISASPNRQNRPVLIPR